MAERPERSTYFQDPEMQAKLKVKLLARQREDVECWQTVTHECQNPGIQAILGHQTQEILCNWISKLTEFVEGPENELNQIRIFLASLADIRKLSQDQRPAGSSAPASQADDSEQNTTEQQETDDQLVADLEDTVESVLPARNKSLNPEASQSDEPQQISSEKAQDSGSEVVAALQSSSEDQQANRDKVSNPLPSAPNGCERNRIEALQNHESVADLQSGLEVRQASGDKNSSPLPSTPHGQGDDRMKALQQTRNEVVEGLQLTSENPQRGRISPRHLLLTFPPFRQLAEEPPRSTTGSAEDTNASFLEDIEHAEQFPNNAMNTRMVESVAPNIKELSWKAPWTQFSEIFLEVQKCLLNGGIKSGVVGPALVWPSGFFY